MSKYPHTLADAVELATICQKRVAAGTGVALSPASTDLVEKALRHLIASADFAKIVGEDSNGGRL